MDKQKQAIRQVLDTLERLPPLVRGVKEIMHSIIALREALDEQALSKVTSDEHCKGLGEELHKLAEQAEQEPVIRATLAPPAPPEVYQMRSKEAYEAGWWEAQRQKAVSPIAPAQQAEQECKDCTRSHPHEEMSKCCELRTEIARLSHSLRVKELAEQAEQEHIANADKMVTTLKITLPKQGKCKCGDKRFPVFSGNREYCETCGWPIVSCEHQRKPDHCGDATEKVGQDCGGAQHHRYAGSFGG